MPSSSHEIGKVVGLLVPESIQLPALQAGFHATQSDPAYVHNVVNQLIQRQVGVIGATVKNEELEGYSWINTIELLTRWVLTLLPASGAPVTVKVFIEQRAPYAAGADLSALAETLQNQLRLLSPERLGQLKLSLAMIKKTGHPYNGYVDSLAYLWGSPKPVNKRFLLSSGLAEQCLIEADSHRFERLFLALNHQQKLEPVDWYAMAAIEPESMSHTALGECLRQLGQRCQEDESRWLQYLSYSRREQQQKQYYPHDLYYACQWLEEYVPATLAPIAKLQLLSIQLAAANHMGRVESALAKQAEALARQLLEENAQLCCEVALRIIVTYCNAFEFEKAQAVVNHWLKVPKLAIGTENHAKLLSSAGQVMAFLGDAAANDYFEQSLSHFAKLNDKRQLQKQSQQTRHYQALWLMDYVPHTDAAVSALEQALGVESAASLRGLATRFARGEATDRFGHYLLLRACVKVPKKLEAVVRAYWSQKQNWQVGTGHPWALINFYRALILWQSPLQKTTDEALSWANQALKNAKLQSQGRTLHTIANAIDAVIQKMQSSTPSSYPVEQIVSEISATLPFNFH